MIIIEKYMTEDLKLGGSELLVYAMIASNLNEYNEFIKLKATIAKNTGLSERTVLRCLNELKNKKYIKIKAVRDGTRCFNIISIDNKCNEFIQDTEFNAILDYWGKLISKEDPSKTNYEAFKYLKKNPKYTIDSFKEAIRWYAATINFEGYYKTYIYRFARFVYLWEKYLPGSYEQKAFMTWLKTNKPCIAAGYKPFDPTEATSNEDLSEIEI